jgi:hypothetical protein
VSSDRRALVAKTRGVQSDHPGWVPDRLRSHPGVRPIQKGLPFLAPPPQAEAPPRPGGEGVHVHRVQARDDPGESLPRPGMILAAQRDAGPGERREGAGEPIPVRSSRRASASASFSRAARSREAWPHPGGPR